MPEGGLAIQDRSIDRLAIAERPYQRGRDELLSVYAVPTPIRQRGWGCCAITYRSRVRNKSAIGRRGVPRLSTRGLLSVMAMCWPALMVVLSGGHQRG